MHHSHLTHHHLSTRYPAALLSGRVCGRQVVWLEAREVLAWLSLMEPLHRLMLHWCGLQGPEAGEDVLLLLVEVEGEVPFGILPGTLRVPSLMQTHQVDDQATILSVLSVNCITLNLAISLPLDSFCVMKITSSFLRLSSPLVWPIKSYRALN